MEYEIRWWFGSPFASQVCDDGPSGVIGPFAVEEGKAALAAWAARQQCPTYLAADGMSASCENYNGSTTGGASLMTREQATAARLAANPPPARCGQCGGVIDPDFEHRCQLERVERPAPLRQL